MTTTAVQQHAAPHDAAPQHDPDDTDRHHEVSQRHCHRGADEKREVTLMQLSALIDLKAQAKAKGSGIPCRDNDAELWFAESPADVEFAKSLCGTCPAVAECLAGAQDRQEPWGVWGGQLIVQGAVVARKRPRGRPRKNDVAA